MVCAVNGDRSRAESSEAHQVTDFALCYHVNSATEKVKMENGHILVCGFKRSV